MTYEQMIPIMGMAQDAWAGVKRELADLRLDYDDQYAALAIARVENAQALDTIETQANTIDYLTEALNDCKAHIAALTEARDEESTKAHEALKTTEELNYLLQDAREQERRWHRRTLIAYKLLEQASRPEGTETATLPWQLAQSLIPGIQHDPELPQIMQQIADADTTLSGQI